MYLWQHGFLPVGRPVLNLPKLLGRPSNESGERKLFSFWFPKSRRSIFFFSEHSSSVVDILKGVTLEAQRGEITSIAGPSGCGKSTLLYLMGLLERPGSGKILMDNMEVQNLSDRKRTIARNKLIGFVFQFHFLIKELTALENVRLPLLKNGTDRTIANKISSDLLDDLGLKTKHIDLLTNCQVASNNGLQ